MAAWKAGPFTYLVFSLKSGGLANYLGMAFPIAPNGGLLTCRHVVESVGPEGKLAVVGIDDKGPKFIEDVRFPANPELDIAFLPDVEKGKAEFFPIMVPDEVIIGSSVNCYGSFTFGNKAEDIEQGYFTGAVVSFAKQRTPEAPLTMMLPFPILEGMSGSALTSFHNGTKLYGIVYGNRGVRIVKHEVIEYQDTEKEYRETINRVGEFGLAYHPSTIIKSLEEMEAEGFIVSNERVDIPGLPK